MPKIHLLYATREGQTRQIAERLAGQWLELGIETCLHDLAQMQSDTFIRGLKNPSDYQAGDGEYLVLGASVRYGCHQKPMVELVRQQLACFEDRALGFFTVNLTARKAGRITPNENPYIRKFLRQMRWQPPVQGVFAGAVRYSQYNVFETAAIRFLMTMGRGHTDTSSDMEYTDWSLVSDFGVSVHAEVCRRAVE